MTPLRTADLKHRVTFHRQDRIADGKGGFTTTWPELARAMAEVRGLDGRESVMERVLEGVSVYRIRIRWRAGLDLRESDQVKHAGRDLNIKSAVDPDGMREQLLIIAETASAQVMG